MALRITPSRYLKNVRRFGVATQNVPEKVPVAPKNGEVVFKFWVVSGPVQTNRAEESTDTN